MTLSAADKKSIESSPPTNQAAMLEFRTFCNSDPPLLAEIWRSRGSIRGIPCKITPELLEQFVFSRPYFDYEGLILAFEGGRPVGFAHAGFGPNRTHDAISTELGTTCLIMVRPDCNETKVAAELLSKSEEYLASRGTKVIYGGAISPLNAFYLGLYGGSELPGVLQSDAVSRNVYNAAGYKEIDRAIIFKADVHSFRAPMTRQLMQIRRRMLVNIEADFATNNWWEACTLGNFELTRYSLHARTGSSIVAHATLRNMNPTAITGSGGNVGLIDLHVDSRHRRQGVVSFLLSEIFHQLARQGVSAVEVQTMRDNAAAVGLYRKLGFQEIDQGIVFRKQ
ncbi:MAG: GNAT family N-acetyltransferase [Pirellulales bacterium]|nr:GNAT family N-acetyltransferase [Pirellulales bacterium]